MDVRHALLAVLSTVSLTACPSAWNCHPDEEQFDLDEAVTAAEIDALVSNYGAEDWDGLACESVCREKYREVRGWETGSTDSCELTLPADPDGSGEPGRVICSGKGFEYYCEGRRPLGHVEGRDDGCGDELGRSLAGMAHLEAASILAFTQLAEQLAGFGAPAELIARCQAAAEDERRHARWLTALAERHGATVPEAGLEPAAQTLADVAVHNAIEGCVHETFAALLAACRAQSAASPVLRAVFTRITVDETRHGQLAWDLHAWLRDQLSESEAGVVELAQARALARLPERARQLASLPGELGPLTASEAEALAAGMVERLRAA